MLSYLRKTWDVWLVIPLAVCLAGTALATKFYVIPRVSGESREQTALLIERVQPNEEQRLLMEVLLAERENYRGLLIAFSDTMAMQSSLGLCWLVGIGLRRRWWAGDAPV